MTCSARAYRLGIQRIVRATPWPGHRRAVGQQGSAARPLRLPELEGRALVVLAARDPAEALPGRLLGPAALGADAAQRGVEVVHAIAQVDRRTVHPPPAAAPRR